MGQNLLPYVDDFSRLSIVVIGDAMLDVYLHGTTSRLCREAPVPIVTLGDRCQAPGGAANTAANLAALGATVHLVAAIGVDEDGRDLRNALRRAGVRCDGLVDVEGRRTLSKTRVLSGEQMLLRIDRGGIESVSRDTEARLIAALEDAFASADAIIVSDYGYGVTTDAVLTAIHLLHRARPIPIVVDGKDLLRYRDLQPSLIKPNYEEVLHLLQIEPRSVIGGRSDFVLSQGERILRLTGASVAAVTLDREGAVVFEAEEPPYRTFARPVADSRAAGAGDTFTAAFALSLTAGASVPAAAEIASAAAAVTVAKDGTTVCSIAELRSSLTAEDKVAPNATTLAVRLQLLREQGKRIVFTNGCFDLIHRGHVAYLNGAKALGDVLVVAVNSDESVRRLKGPERPITMLDDRLQVLSALSCVDYLVPFEEDTPAALIESIRPDVFVKGGDYTRETLPEATIVQGYGGTIEILPYVGERSTTNIITRIRAAVA